jgi:hypothetical protein
MSQKEIILDKKLYIIEVSGKILQILKFLDKIQERVKEKRNQKREFGVLNIIELSEPNILL